MLQLDNDTPFSAHLSVLPDVEGVDTLFVVLKATFAFQPSMRVAEQQLPVLLADDYMGEPGTSSLRHAGDVHFSRPGTDVILTGDAVAPGAARVERLDVSVSVAGAVHTVRVFGDRQWVSGVQGVRPGSARRFSRMPLIYERAFGGTIRDAAGCVVAAEMRNPVGVGLWPRGSVSAAAGAPLPNLEDPRHPLRVPGECPPPAGTGPVAPSWQPRVGLAGTYDEAWQRGRAPLLPSNFDPRFFHVALTGLTLQRHLMGGEPVRLVGVSATGPQSFNLPTCIPMITVALGAALHRPPVLLERVHLEPSDDRLCMLFRAALPCDKQALKVRAVKLSIQELSLS